MGPTEQQVVDTFDPGQHEGGAFKWISMINYAPDGEHILSEIFFFVCPLCGSMVPAPNTDPEQGPIFEPDDWHVQWHRKVARLEDRIAALEGPDA